MELVSFVLLVFFWPNGDADGQLPKWTSDAYITLEECEAEAAVKIQELRQQYGDSLVIYHQCFNREDGEKL